MVQVRTTKVGDVNATGFTGIAIKEGDTETIQVNLQPGGSLVSSTALYVLYFIKSLQYITQSTVHLYVFILSFYYCSQCLYLK